MQNKSIVQRGFTLVEILIAVLIIGVLMAIAVPKYQSAIDKSRWAKLISPSKAIATAEEVILMSSGAYTVNKDDLAVSLPADSEYDYQLYTSANGDTGDFVRVSSDKLDDVRLARYYEKDAKFSKHLYCEAKSTNERAKKLCGKLLQGSELFTTDDGYKAYFLSGQVNEAVCGAANGFWSGSKNTCYSTQADKCAAVGGNALSNGQCGWINTNDKVLGNEQFCLAKTSSQCMRPTINDGGICYVAGGAFSCGGGANGAINNGGICAMASDASRGCNIAVNAGGVCYANTQFSCEGPYNGGCCCGRWCNSRFGPTCDPDKCSEVRAKLTSLGLDAVD